MKKKHLILIQLGTPESPSWRDVRRFLGNFLMDPMVIELPLFFRAILVKGIIQTFRTPKSAGRYRQIWDPETGSPLLYHSRRLVEKVAQRLGDEWEVHLAMRYSNPSIREVVDKVRRSDPEVVRLLPMFPQEAVSTTGTILKQLPEDWVARMPPDLNRWVDHEEYIRALVNSLVAKKPWEFHHVLFSFHGLPLQQVHYAHPGSSCEELNCQAGIHEANRNCYQASSYEIARKVAEGARLTPNQWSLAFQSRFGPKWLGPQSEEILKNLPRQGVRKLLVMSPSFTADCLETSWEIGISFKETFLRAGGHHFDWVRSLNDADELVEVLTSDRVTK